VRAPAVGQQACMKRTVYLVRHGTPDLTRTDLPYHLIPGPPLTPQGELEAAAVGRFLRDNGVRQLWASPLERTWRTAVLAAAEVAFAVGSTVEISLDHCLAEMQPGETHDDVRVRMWPAWERAVGHARARGPAAIVTHGGPITAILQALQVPQALLDEYGRRFDHGNPLPPAGAWRVTMPPPGAAGGAPGAAWETQLAFVPDLGLAPR
jgi:broad specificity phosphatase PhoE